jgi:hypothetical protein
MGESAAMAAAKTQIAWASSFVKRNNASRKSVIIWGVSVLSYRPASNTSASRKALHPNPAPKTTIVLAPKKSVWRSTPPNIVVSFVIWGIRPFAVRYEVVRRWNKRSGPDKGSACPVMGGGNWVPPAILCSALVSILMYVWALTTPVFAFPFAIPTAILPANRSQGKRAGSVPRPVPN